MATEFDNLILRWNEKIQALAVAKQEELELRNALITMGWGPAIGEGTHTKELGEGWQLKAKGVYNYKLDKDNEKVLKAIEKIDTLAPSVGAMIVRWKPELNVSMYRELMPTLRAVIQEVLTITPGQPQLELVPPKTAKKPAPGKAA